MAVVGVVRFVISEVTLYGGDAGRERVVPPGPPYDPRQGLLQGPRGVRFLVSEVPL